ncbi:MAG: hypothetical protein GXO68_04905 [Crenarchaeota archaeon]|nr:hypothetical protein [Thermoproteota archaeon]
MLNRVGYVIVYVRDMDSMVSFWRDKLGLKPSYVSSEWSEFPLDNIILAFHHSRDAQAGHTGIVFQVDDIHETVNTLRNAGVDVSEVRDIGVGLEVTLTDPEGNKYNLFKPKP